MKKIDTLQVTDPSVLQPFTARSLKFLQDATAEDVAGIIKSIVTSNLGSYSLTVPYVISGCVYDNTSLYGVTAGEIFYGGKYYETTAIANNTATNIPRFVLTLSQDATADPVTFSDSSSKNVHNIYKYVATDAASGGDFTAANLVSLYGTTTITTSTTPLAATAITVTASSGSFTYSTDSYYYSYYIEKGICFLNFKTVFTVTGGAVVSKINIPLPTGVTKATTLTEDNCFRGMASFSAAGGTTNYVMLHALSNDGGGEGQRITLKRFADGDTDITMSTVVTTIAGSIQFPIA